MVPFSRLIEVLSCRPYSHQLFAFWSVATLNITTAPSYDELKSNPIHRNIVCIAYLRDKNQFLIGFGESPDSDWDMRWDTASNEWMTSGSWKLCGEERAVDLVDSVVARDLEAFGKRQQELH
jgi:hypothetical protein